MTSTEELKRLLLSHEAPAIVEAPLEIALDPELAKALKAEGYFVTLVDRAPVFNRQTLMHALYQSCEFPAYFGFNWDALYDLLSQANQGYVLIFKDFALLQERSLEDAGMFKEVIEDAAATRREADAAPLHLVIGQP